MFKVIELDLEHGRVVLQEGIDWLEEVLFDQYWYLSENIPPQFLEKGKTFKVLSGKELQFQEVEEWVHPHDEFAISRISEIGMPVTK